MQVAIHNHCDYQDDRVQQQKERARAQPFNKIPEALLDLDRSRGAFFAGCETAAAVVRTATGMTKEEASLAVRGHVTGLCGHPIGDSLKRDEQGARPRVTLPGDPTHEDPEGRE
jgi:hypothetical protein